MTQTRDLIKKMADFFTGEEFYEKGEDARLELSPDDVRCVIQLIKAQPKTGHWEWLTEDKYRCSNCNSETRVDECLNEPMYDFCPFCGAKMSESEDKE